MISTELLLDTFCKQHTLPEHYHAMAQQWFIPLALSFAGQHSERAQSGTQQPPLLIGINGCQGSGKSTLAALLKVVLEEQYQKSTLILSIDDFYLTRQERQLLADNIHPLFATRGVPGTHDIHLLQTCLDQLRAHQYPIEIPRFDKATDDRYSKEKREQWDSVQNPVDIVILEGWCVGSSPQEQQTLPIPVNTLEATEDDQQIWRNTSNSKLAEDYQSVFKRIDQLVMLKAPSFDCVYQWRKHQEDKLRKKIATTELSSSMDTMKATTKIMTDEELLRFIQHYQRITEHTLATLPNTANVVFTLNHQHQVTQQHINP